MSKTATKTRSSLIQNPNNVGYNHFKRAVDLAKKCKPEPSKKGKPYPRVGVVIVKNGRKISEAFRGEVGVGEHAEYIALEKKAGGNPKIQGADLITTLEPCTTRAHPKLSCVSWIKSRNIRKVWIATIDHNPAIAGLGELHLQKEGILIGRFPDDLASVVLEDNQEFFEWIESKQPMMTAEERKQERLILIDKLKASQRNLTQMFELAVNKATSPLASKQEKRDWERIVDEWGQRRDDLNTVSNQILALDIESVGSWVQLGTSFRILKMHGPASLSYRVATQVDATSEGAWKGMVQSEVELHRGMVEWPFHNTIDEIDTSPMSLKSRTWLELAEEEEDTAMKIRMAARSLQLGQEIREVWKFIKALIDQTREFHLTSPKEELSRKKKRKYLDKLKDEGNAWWFLGNLFESIGEKRKRNLCHRTMNAIVWGIDETEFKINGKRPKELE